MREPQSTVGISPAALFRIIQEKTPTLVIDEAETLTNGSETAQNLISILNAGYRMGKGVMRCEPPAMKVTSFQVYCPKVLCAINDLPDTIMDRAVVVRMKRKNGANLKKFRFSEAGREAAPIRERIDILLGPDTNLTARLEIQQNWREMSDADALGRWVQSDRDIENLMPLAALCWYLDSDRAADFEKSCVALNGTRNLEDSTLGARLCQDLAEIISDETRVPLEQTHVSNADLVNALREIDDSPWADKDKFNANRMSRLLRPYGLRSTKFGSGSRGSRMRGYQLQSLRNALSPYLSVPPSPGIETKELSVKTSVPKGDSQNQANSFVLTAGGQGDSQNRGKEVREPVQ